MLREMQQQFARALREGPAAVPHQLFEGDARRITLAFASHANTVSHGRLVALEDSFPQTRNRLGEEHFNRLSRDFLDGGHGGGEALGQIGRTFPDWLADQGETAAVLVARYDWARLEAHRAAEAETLSLADLASLNGEELLEQPVVLHPAARCVASDATLCEALELEQTAALLIARPDAALHTHALTKAQALAFAEAKKSATFGNLFAALPEQLSNETILPALQALIGFGALAKQGAK